MVAIFSKFFDRPSTDVPFPPESETLKQYMLTKYAGKCLTWREASISNNGLNKICQSTWVSLQELEIALKQEKDSGPLFEDEAKRMKYCSENNISVFNFYNSD